MLSAPHRLRDSAGFAAAVRRGRRAGGQFLVVHMSQSDSKTEALVGFVVSKSVGSAVTRNKVKRRLRHASSPLVAALPSGTIAVVRALPGASSATFAELESELSRLIERASA